MSVVCIQQPSGQCSLVQTSQVVQGMPDPAARMPAGSAIAAANPTPTSHKSDFALQFILFIIGDGIKVINKGDLDCGFGIINEGGTRYF